MAQLQSQCIHSLVLIATPDGHRKHFETAQGKGKLRDKAMAGRVGLTVPCLCCSQKTTPKTVPKWLPPERWQKPPRFSPQVSRLRHSHHREQEQTMPQAAGDALSQGGWPVRTSMNPVKETWTGGPAQPRAWVRILPHPNASPALLGSPIHPSADPDDKSQSQGCSHGVPSSAPCTGDSHPHEPSFLGSVLHPTSLINSAPFPRGSLEAAQRREGRGF